MRELGTQLVLALAQVWGLASVSGTASPIWTAARLVAPRRGAKGPEMRPWTELPAAARRRVKREIIAPRRGRSEVEQFLL